LEYILEGILFGLTLTILLGPIFIALTETSIKRGLKPGLMVGLGIWTSDFLIIALCYLFINYIQRYIETSNIQFWMGIIGGIVLVCFGLGAIIRKVRLDEAGIKYKAKDYLSFWTKGFLVNTVNPFTFIFWISVITTYVIGRALGKTDTLLFMGSILLTIVITDSFKVYLAKWLRNRLHKRQIIRFSRIAGLGLILFGIGLIARVSNIF
jgi:threonine/homoserine/homoserine lactone efflux protein